MQLFFDLTMLLFFLLVLGAILGFGGFLGILTVVVFLVVLAYALFWLLIFGGIAAILKWIITDDQSKG